MSSTSEDRDLIRSLSGLYVGQLDESEYQAFHRCFEDGLVIPDYAPPHGLIFIGKVKWIAIEDNPNE